jgi:AcrR family transcriptional regulator
METKQPKRSTADNRKTRYTKMVLRESLMELMKTKAIAAISIKELCAAADISRSTFYAHYTDQYDLLRKTEEEILAVNENILKKYSFHKNNTREALRMMEEILQFFADNNKSLYVLLSENGDINFQKTLISYIYQKNFLKSLTGKFPDERTKEYYFLFIVTGGIGIIYHWIKNGMNEPIDELARLIINITAKIGL